MKLHLLSFIRMLCHIVHREVVALVMEQKHVEKEGTEVTSPTFSLCIHVLVLWTDKDISEAQTSRLLSPLF